ncbi:hypothetical protein [Haematobacter sp. UBA3484]|uniref:hypothetical protein n=1 Tax=Haematobacter sp. UBA3484 TaxID=1946582 RepID=UPI0025C22BC2|nr:hypothetical protein [Haematobacter sp. UBA3484]
MFVKGQWKAVCDRCGNVYLSRQLRKEPTTGLMVCDGAGTCRCYDPRDPQLDVKGKADRQSPPWVRPEPPIVWATPITQDDL